MRDAFQQLDLFKNGMSHLPSKVVSFPSLGVFRAGRTTCQGCCQLLPILQGSTQMPEPPSHPRIPPPETKLFPSPSLVRLYLYLSCDFEPVDILPLYSS